MEDSLTIGQVIWLTAYLWLLGLSLAMVLQLRRPYLRATEKLVTAPFRWSGRTCRRLLSGTVRRSVLTVRWTITRLVLWLFDRLRQW